MPSHVQGRRNIRRPDGRAQRAEDNNVRRGRVARNTVLTNGGLNSLMLQAPNASRHMGRQIVNNHDTRGGQVTGVRNARRDQRTGIGAVANIRSNALQNNEPFLTQLLNELPLSQRLPLLQAREGEDQENSRTILNEVIGNFCEILNIQEDYRDLSNQGKIFQEIDEKTTWKTEDEKTALCQSMGNWDADELTSLNRFAKTVRSLAGGVKDNSLHDDEKNTLKEINNLLVEWKAAKKDHNNNFFISSFKKAVAGKFEKKEFSKEEVYALAAYFGWSYQYINGYLRKQFDSVKKGLDNYGAEPEFWSKDDWDYLLDKTPVNPNNEELNKLLEELIGKKDRLQMFFKYSFWNKEGESSNSGTRSDNKLGNVKKRTSNFLSLDKGRYYPNSKESPGLLNYTNDRLLEIKLRLAFSKAPTIPGPITVFRGTGSILAGREKMDERDQRNQRHTTKGDYGLLEKGDLDKLKEANKLDSLENKVIYEAGYMSTTFTRSKVQTSALNSSILLVIHVPGGRRAMPATKETEGRPEFDDSLRHEDEITFPPGQKIRIISVEAGGEGNTSYIIRGTLI